MRSRPTVMRHGVRTDRRHRPEPDRDLRRRLHHQCQHLYRRAGLSRARTGPAARAAADLECRRQQPAQRDRRAKRDRLCADLLRRPVEGRLLRRWCSIPRRSSGSSSCWSASRLFVLRQTGSGSRASVPGAALSAHADPVLPDVRLYAVFEPGLCGEQGSQYRRLDRHRRVAARSASDVLRREAKGESA